MIITNKTNLNMVIGYPLYSTQSPILHNFVYETLNIDAVLLAFSYPHVKSLIQSIKTLSIGLTAITMPFKEKVLKYLDHCSVEAQLLNAVNTIIHDKGKLYGYNTDIDGITYALRNVPLSNKHVLIIGAGGAASAVAYYAQKNRAKLLWLNRTHKHAIRLIKKFGGSIVNFKQIHDMPIDIIVNATPLGMFPNVNNSPLPSYRFKPEQTVFDMVYNPVNTKLLRQAELKGANIVSGLEMFIGQGLRQIELWTNEAIDKNKMVGRIRKQLIKNQHSHKIKGDVDL